MVSKEQKKIKIELESIETPLGEVPTIESMKKIADALNIINEEIIKSNDNINEEVIKEMKDVKKEIIVFRKIFSENVISNEKINIRLNDIESKIQNLTNKINQLEQNLKIIIADSIHHFLSGAAIK